MIFPQGRVLGGGSSINAMVYTRGHALDYDAWAREEGCAGWSYADVLPYFRRAEDNERLVDRYHGSGGPLGVCRPGQPALPDPGLRARRAGGRPAVQPGLQRRAPGGLRPLPGDPARRAALQRGRRLPQAGARARQPHRADRLPRDPDPGRARPRGRRRVPRRATRPSSGPRAPSGGGGRERCGRLAQAPAAVRHRAGRRARSGSASRRSTTCRASAATCRTTSTST